MQKLQADPNDVDALLELANLFMRQNSPESAQGFINRALVAARATRAPPTTRECSTRARANIPKPPRP